MILDNLHLSNRITHGNLVAGAAAEGHGILTAWTGRHARTGADLALIVGELIPSEWLPAPKEPATQLGRAMQAAAGYLYVAKPVRKSYDPEKRALETWLARWMLVRMPTAEGVKAGDTFGDIELVATLRGDENAVVLQCEVAGTDNAETAQRRSQLCEAVRTGYHALVGAQVHSASDITRWLSYTLRTRLQCVRYGSAYYAPLETRDTVEALVNALRGNGWGSHWMYPPLPVATTGQLALGLAMGLALDVQELAEDVAVYRQAVRAEGKPDIGPRALASAIAKLDAVKARINFYADRLGDARSEVDGPVQDLEVTFEEIAQGHAARAEAS